MYPLCMIVGSSGQGKVMSQEDRIPGTTEGENHRVRRMAVAHPTASTAEIRAAVGTTVTQRTVTNRLLQGQLRDRRPVACIPLTPQHCRLRREWCQARVRGRSGDLLCFLMKAGSALVPVMAVCWLEGGQVSASNQPVCGLDTWNYGLGLNFL
ncbi:hypothetical protein AVEN_48255-1 [Araneus ventricosus]|uniref:Transposase Tc1-like domain-containing protein n=1 Tax=Araneus ventricosus TaxID=182803 RepID=A0A4Y2IG96_ARAVE|nr:hypothetical protein AVEN_45289-1 [Araneus ventricosus]GBM76787.1 hypothetical protein AVEN_48255-1 [Araneus ventricosus]